MKKIYFLFFLLLPIIILAQETDTIKVKLEIDSLISISRNMTMQQNFDEALLILDEAQKKSENAFGKNNAKYISCLFGRGIIYYVMGRFELSEAYMLEAKEIQGKVYGKETLYYIRILTNLSNVKIDLDNYSVAESLALEAKVLFEKSLNKEHPDYANILTNLGSLYYGLGQFEAAEPLFLEAKAIRQKIYGKQHAGYAASLNNLGSLYLAMGRFNDVEPLYKEAISISEKTQGKENADYAGDLHNLASLYLVLGRFDSCELLLLESKAILERAVGKEHPIYATNLDNLANLYNEIGLNEKAEALYLEAKTIREKIIGKEHTDYLGSLVNLASIYEKEGRYNECNQILKESEILNKFLIQKAVYYLSERQLTDYIKTFQVNNETLLSYALIRNDRKNSSKIISGLSYDNALYFKGFLLTVVNQLNNLAVFSLEGKRLKNELKFFQSHLAQQYAAPIAERDSATVVDLEEKVNTLEKELVRTVSGFAEAKAQVTWKDVQSKLKPGEAAIEFVHFKYSDPKPTDSSFYSALVLLPGDSFPFYATLFEEKELKNILSTSNTRRMEYVANLYKSNVNNEKNLPNKKYKSLYDLIWKPLEPKLEKVKTIYFSPSGLLHQINQNAISINGYFLLSDKYNLVQLGSTRQLVIHDKTLDSKPNSACLIGGINFDMDSTAMVAPKQANNSSLTALRSELSFAYTDSSLRGGSWKYLSGSEKEIKEIQNVFSKAGIRSTNFQGNAATEESFKKLGDYNSASPQIIHISTHGYFFPDPKDNNKQSIINSQKEPVFKISEHPMIRSGLILAGANNAWKTGKPLRPDMEDGILTAYEISQLNLRNTELVVLSACETGLGDIQGNEGVYGLQRAFKIAGVKNLIMSLWQVPDKETSELMTIFYKNWLLKKMSIRESLLSAQNTLRKRGLAVFYWAGFVLVE